MEATQVKLTWQGSITINPEVDYEDGRWGVHWFYGPWWNDLGDYFSEDHDERYDCYYIYERQTGTVYAIIPARHAHIFTPELALKQFLDSQNLVSAINQMLNDIG